MDKAALLRQKFSQFLVCRSITRYQLHTFSHRYGILTYFHQCHLGYYRRHDTSQKPESTPTTVSSVPAQNGSLQDALDELNALEGLASVKKEISSLVAFLKIQKERAQHGMKVSSQALHYVFHGNPGTGKTSVSRILAKVFHGFGILKTTRLTETDRSGLVAGYVGQTAIKTDDVVKNRWMECFSSLKPIRLPMRKATGISARKPSTRCSNAWRITATASL